MENFKIDAGIYLPQEPQELISPLLQDYKNTAAFIPSEQDYAQSISMPGDSITDLINKVETYNAMSRDIINQPNPDMPVGPGYSFDMGKSVSSLHKALNPSSPSLSAASRPENLGSATDLARYAESGNFQTFGYVPSLGSEQEYRYGRAMTWGDTMGKALAGGGALAWDTFVEGWTGWARMAQALGTWDSSKLMGSEAERYEIARKQEEIFNKYAIYNTAEAEDSLLNRQFFGNMMQQAGFTVGAAGQMILESYLTAGIGKAISASVGSIAKARALKTAGTVGELINDTRKAQQVISNSQRVTNALKQFPRAVVPLFGTVEDAVKAGKAGAGALQIGMIGLGGIKRELSMFNMARSEAIFEAASTYKEMEDKLVQEFASRNGREPNEAELETIRKTADNASSDNFASNLGILTMMNRIQFGNMFKNFNTSRKIFSANATAFGEDVFEVSGKVGGKSVKKVYEKGFVGRLGAVRDISKTFGRKAAAWEATKSMGLGLMKFEGSEGAQELLQEASNKGLSKYHYDLYHGSKGYDSKIDNVLSSIQNPLTDIDGAKTFLMGALTGRFIAPFSYAGSKIMAGKEGKELAAKKSEAVNIINTFYSDPTQYAKEWIANVKVQNRAAANMEEAVANGDRYTFYNTKDSAFAKAVSAAIKLNMYESLKDSMTELGSDLTDQEFKEAFNLEPATANRKNVSQFMGKVVSQMDDYYTLYNNLKDKYGDRIVPELYRYADPAQYQQVRVAKIALDNAIEMLTTNVFKARQSTKRAVQLQQEMGANTNIGASSIEVLTKLGSEQSIEDHVSMLAQEISFYDEAPVLTPEQKAILKIKKQELKLAQAWKESFEDVMTGQGESYFAEGSVKKIYEAYENLVNFYNKTEQKNVTVSMEDIEDNFSKFLDYIQLNKDSKAYVDAMNLLADPYNMNLIIEATKSSIDEMGKIMQQEHVEEVNKVGEEQVADVKEAKSEESIQVDDNVEKQKEEALAALGQKQFTKAFEELAEATKPEQVAKAIVTIEQNVNQGARLSPEQEQKLAAAKEQLKKEGYEIVSLPVVRTGVNVIIQSSLPYEGQILTKEQVDQLESFFRSRERQGRDIEVDDLPTPVARVIEPMLNKDGKMVQAATVVTYVFDNVEQAKEAIAKSKAAGYKAQTAADKIAAKFTPASGTAENAEMEKAFKEAYEKYKADAASTGQSVANYDQWKDFSAAGKEIRKKFEGTPAADSTENEPETYAQQFDVAAVNTENISQDVVEDILSSTESQKSDNFDGKADDFFTNLTVCNI